VQFAPADFSTGRLKSGKGRTNEVAAAFANALTDQDKLYRDAVNLVDADSAGNPGLLTLLVSQEQRVAGPSGALAEQPPDQIEVKLQKLLEQVKELSKTPAGGERWRELVGAVDKSVAATAKQSTKEIVSRLNQSHQTIMAGIVEQSRKSTNEILAGHAVVIDKIKENQAIETGKILAGHRSIMGKGDERHLETTQQTTALLSQGAVSARILKEIWGVLAVVHPELCAAQRLQSRVDTCDDQSHTNGMVGNTASDKRGCVRVHESVDGQDSHLNESFKDLPRPSNTIASSNEAIGTLSYASVTSSYAGFTCGDRKADVG